MLLLLTACLEGAYSTWTVPGPVDEDTGAPAIRFDPQEGITVEQECTGDPDPPGCCLEGCDVAAELCQACGEPEATCAASWSTCTRACESYCGSTGCGGFEPVEGSGWADCGG